jgi:serine protease Do
VQWVMHMAKEPAALQAVVRRGSDKVDLTLNLNRGWRRGSDISWRPTSWELRRMAFGGMLLEDMSPAARAKAGLKPDQLALHVKHVGQYGEHALAKKAGWLKDDIIVAVEGRSARLRETDLFAYIMQTKAPGTKLPAVVLRNGQRMNLELPSQ